MLYPSFCHLFFNLPVAKQCEEAEGLLHFLDKLLMKANLPCLLLCKQLEHLYLISGVISLFFITSHMTLARFVNTGAS